MKIDFKTKLQELINAAAKNYDNKFIEEGNFKDSFHCATSFKQGAQLLMPLIESLIEIRNDYIDYRCGYPDLELKTESDKDLLNLLKDGR